MYCIAEPFFTSFAFQFVKNTAISCILIVFPLLMYLPVALAALAIPTLDVTYDNRSAAMVLEVIFSIIPTHAITLAYIKIVYRARLYVTDGVPNTDPWSFSGCKI